MTKANGQDDAADDGDNSDDGESFIIAYVNKYAYNTFRRMLLYVLNETTVSETRLFNSHVSSESTSNYKHHGVSSFSSINHLRKTIDKIFPMVRNATMNAQELSF